MTIDDPVTMARELLQTDDVVVGKGQAPHMLATAQTWATRRWPRPSTGSRPRSKTTPEKEYFITSGPGRPS